MTPTTAAPGIRPLTAQGTSRSVAGIESAQVTEVAFSLPGYPVGTYNTGMEWMEAEIPGLPALQVGDCRLTSRLEYDVLLSGQSLTCSQCGGKLSRSGYGSASLFDLPRGLHPVVLHVRWARLRCTSGCRQPHPLTGVQAGQDGGEGRSRQRGRALTVRLQEALVRQYLAGQTVPQLSAWCGVTADTLWELLSEELRALDALPPDPTRWQNLTHLGIDELFWRGRVLCVLMDLVTGRLIDVLPDRESATLKATLQELPAA